MFKLTKQNVNGTDYSMVGCSLTGACASAASDYVKIVTLSDGDAISDGMSVVITFVEGNTAGNAPSSQTIYSSDQVNYYADAGLTQPFTLAPSGCYTVEYTGEGNAYTYQSFPVLQIGAVTASVCDARGHKAADKAWKAGEKVTVQYTGGLFLIASMGDNAVNSVTQGEMRPVTSNAVAQYVPPLAAHATSADTATSTANADYAFEAGSAIKAGNADEADWAINQGFSHQFIDCSSLDQNTWYPCTLNLSTNTPTQIYCCTALDGKSHPSWATHSGGFTALLHIEAIGGGWGATGAQGIVFRNNQAFFTGDAPVGFAFSSPSNYFIFYLRGGGVYDLANNKGQTFRLEESGFTDLGGEVFGPMSAPPVVLAKATITADLNGKATEAGNADTLGGSGSVFYMHNRTGDNGTTAQLQADIVNNGSAGPCCGSYQITDGPFGNIWYNFIYIPHRSGVGGGDNYLWGTLIVFTMTSNTNKMAIKHLMNGSWQGWTEINAGTLGEHQASENATASTVGVRTANGYFNAVIFHDEWIAENINSYSSPTLMFKGGDGYLRSTDPSLVTVGHATSADSATNADHATSADSATNADHANTAEYATNAGNVTHADNADKVGTEGTHTMEYYEQQWDLYLPVGAKVVMFAATISDGIAQGINGTDWCILKEQNQQPYVQYGNLPYATQFSSSPYYDASTGQIRVNFVNGTGIAVTIKYRYVVLL